MRHLTALFMVSIIALGCSIAGSSEPEPPREHRPAGSEAPILAAPPEEAGEAPPAEVPAPSLASKTLYLQPLGQELSKEAVSLVVTALREFYGFTVKNATPRPLPRFAYYAPRKRYRAEKLLGFLQRVAPPDAYRILGLTGVDISTTKGRSRDWGIMGLATLDGRVSVMSMFRCRRGSRDAVHARERLGKVAVHEVGHTLGLEHCPTHGCLMEDARGTNTTTDREYVLCPRCRQFLSAQGITLPPNPQPPWPRP